MAGFPGGLPPMMQRPPMPAQQPAAPRPMPPAGGGGGMAGMMPELVKIALPFLAGLGLPQLASTLKQFTNLGKENHAGSSRPGGAPPQMGGAQGIPPPGAHRPGVRMEAAQAPGTTIAPQLIRQLLQQRPDLLAFFMKQQQPKPPGMM